MAVYRGRMGSSAIRFHAVLALVLSASCSWAGMRTLPDRPIVGTTYSCDESRELPAIDAVLGFLAAAAVAVVGVATVDCLDGTVEPGCSTVSIGLYWVPVAISFGLSARSGFREADRCRAY